MASPWRLWLVAPGRRGAVLPHPIYFTWIVSLVTFFAGRVFDRRRENRDVSDRGFGDSYRSRNGNGKGTSPSPSTASDLPVLPLRLAALLEALDALLDVVQLVELRRGRGA